MNLTHLFHLAQHAVRERAKKGHKLAALVTGEKARSPQWPGLEKSFLADHPKCAACGIVRDAPGAHMNVHHIKPFHLHPELELDRNNLISLCMGQQECHLQVGHGGNFRAYNPNVRADCTTVLNNPRLRGLVVEQAKQNRLTA